MDLTGFNQLVRGPLAGALLFTLSGLHCHAGATAGHYSVQFDEDLLHLQVQACFKGQRPQALEARSGLAPSMLIEPELRHGQRRQRLQVKEGRMALPPGEAPVCVDYGVELDGLGSQLRRSMGWRLGAVVVIDPALWLWYPDTFENIDMLELAFDVPEGFDVSAPWTRLGREGRRVRYLLSDRLPGWEARVAIGRFRVETLDLAGGQVHFALLPGEPVADRASMQKWVEGGIRALISAWGRLPVREVQLLVVPIGRGREPVPWAEVQRGGGDAVHLYIDQRRSLEEFMADWVLVHELSHLLHPVIDSTDRWLSEGIASYYQNVLRARIGLRSAPWAWSALHAGFERGIRDTRPGRSLSGTSQRMMQDGSFMRVYWSGAAIALLADVELRRMSGGQQSLDSVLREFADCCLPADRLWDGQAFMARLDELSGTQIFSVLYRQYANSDHFPDLDAVYAGLGLESTGATRVELDAAAPDADIRRAIMHRPGG